MVFQNMFLNEEVIGIAALSPGYDDHASDVWKVKTSKRDVIVRASGINDLSESIFFASCNILFGIDPRNVFALEKVNNTLSGLNAFPFPKVVGKHYDGKEYVVAEWLPGETLQSFTELSDDELRRFGRNLALIHRHKLDYLGNPLGTFKIELENINRHFIRAAEKIVAAFYSEDAKIRRYFPVAEGILRRLPPPQDTSFVLVDMDPTQFLVRDGIITGLVDTEAYVVAPRELDFVALEYMLDQHGAHCVSQGYAELLELPDLRPVRDVYRYIYRLIEVQSAWDLERWMAQDILF